LEERERHLLYPGCTAGLRIDLLAAIIGELKYALAAEGPSGKPGGIFPLPGSTAFSFSPDANLTPANIRSNTISIC
jgi:hypothetical protein